MSETPRTDAEFKFEAVFDGGGVETVLVEFARGLETELADKDRQLAEARAEIERLERREYQLKKDNLESLDLLAADTALQNRLADQIERKDKLIEQMREALRLALPEARSTHCEQTILAALAAERGE